MSPVDCLFGLRSVNNVVCGQFAYKRNIPEDDARLREILEKYTTDPIYNNIYIDLVGHFPTFYMFVRAMHVLSLSSSVNC